MSATTETRTDTPGSVQRIVSLHVVAIETWAGRRTHPVQIVGDTKTRYRIKALASMMLPGKRFVREGEIVLVPKHAVREGKPSECGPYDGGIYGYAG